MNYAKYYLSIDTCVLDLTQKKDYLSDVRRYWQKINYKSFRYIYTYSYWTYHYKKEKNRDSLYTYHNLALDVEHDKHPYSYENISEAVNQTALYHADIGDYLGAINVLKEYRETDNFLNLSPPYKACLLYTSPSPRDRTRSRMPSSA